MTTPFRGVINVDITQSVPDWEPFTQPIAPEGTPNVLYIVLDDVGYSAMGPRYQRGWLAGGRPAGPAWTSRYSARSGCCASAASVMLSSR